MYTVGYRQRGITVDTLCNWVADGAVIADIRWMAHTRFGMRRNKEGTLLSPWSKGRLTEALGRNYIRIRELGNVHFNALHLGIKIHDKAAGLSRLEGLMKETPVVLLCCCSNFRNCHRTVVAEEAKYAGLCDEIRHLGEDGSDGR